MELYYISFKYTIIPAEPEGGGAPAFCHSVASAAILRT